MEKKKLILNKLFALQRFGIKPGLERTLALLNEVGNPHNEIKTVHIAGTNGKGSVSSFIASFLIEAGKNTGLYTSPHISRFNERIKINSKEIKDKELIDLADLLLPIANKYKCTFFEITTAMAFLYFYHKRVDIAIIETGMGGRFDATNVLNPILSIITKISFDHTQYLGKSLKEISLEKAGIIKQKTPLVLSKNNEEVVSIISQIAKSNQSKLYYSEKIINIKNKKYYPDFSMSFDCKINLANQNLKLIKNIFLPLAGSHQLENFCSAFVAFNLILQNDKNLLNSFERKPFALEQNVKQGLKKIFINTSLKARIQLIKQYPPIIIDVAHNPDAIFNLIQTIEHCGYTHKWDILFAVMSDKDYEKMLLSLKDICDGMILTNLKIERALSVEILKAKALNIGINVIHTTNSTKNALKFALGRNKPLLITGSFYLIDEILTLKYLD